MKITDWIHLMLAITGFSIMLWIVWYALKDMLTIKLAQRKPAHNAVIVVLCLIYLVKIIVADLLPYIS